MESDSFNVEFVLSSLVELTWGPNQSPTIWYFCKSISEDVRLLENGQIPELFEIYVEESHFELIVSILDAAKGVPFAINALNPICVAPPEFPAEIHPEIPPDIPHEILTDIPASIVGGFDQLTTEEAEVREADIFDNEEYVGVDDECLYVPASK